MAVHAVQFGPHHPQIFGPGRNVGLQEFLNPLAVGEGMHETADAADAFDEIDVLDEIFLLGDFFQAAVAIANGGQRFDDAFVFEHQAELQRFGQHGVLRSERDDRVPGRKRTGRRSLHQ